MYVIKDQINHLDQGSSNFSVKGPIVNMLSFVGFVTAIHLCGNILYI